MDGLAAMGGDIAPTKPDWGMLEGAFSAWWNRKLDRPLVGVYSPQDGRGTPDMPHPFWSFVRRHPDLDAAIADWERWISQMCFHGALFPKIWINYGPGSLASYYTGYMRWDEASQTVWLECPTDWDTIAGYSMEHPTPRWNTTVEATIRAAETAQGRWFVGTADIGGPLDVLASLRGAENLLTDLLDEPGLVRETSRRLCNEWFVAFDALCAAAAPHQRGTSAWMDIWCGGRWYPLQCDFAAMISPAMFEKFVAPETREMCRRLDRSIYHLDGPNQIGHLDILLDIPELDGIQWVPGSGVPSCEDPCWYPMYRKILERGKLLVLQCFTENRDIPAIFDKVPGGGVLVQTWGSTWEGARWMMDRFPLP